MDKIMKLLAIRQSGKPVTEFSQTTGIPSAALYKLLSGQRNAGVANLRKLGTWAIKNNDHELIQAIAEYTLDCQFSSFWYIIKEGSNGQTEATNR